MDQVPKNAKISRFSSYLEQVRLYRLDEARNSLSLSRRMRLLFAVLPLCTFLVVIFQLHTSAREDLLLDSTGVVRLPDQAWDVAYYPVSAAEAMSCLSDRCWAGRAAVRQAAAISIPQGDPVGNGRWSVDGHALVRYVTTIDPKLWQRSASPVLYIPGLRCEALAVAVNGRLVQTGFGNLPLFISLAPSLQGKNPATVEVVMHVLPSAGFQGFLKMTPFVGDALNVYRAHHRLEFRSFPRHATVVFLLAIAALTLCFFIFLDHQRELLALSVALSLLGLAQAVRVGVLPFLGTDTYVALNMWFLAFLVWYALEHMRLNKQVPYALLLAPLLPLALRALATYAGPVSEKWVKDGIYYGLMMVPLFLGILALVVASNVWRVSPRRARAILGSGVAFFLYAASLLGLEMGTVAGVAVDRVFDVLTLACASVWITSALSSLGTLEERVAKSREDARELLMLEQELHLAQEVQQAFIHPGRQDSQTFDVATVYKAARKVGGDWLCWRDLGHGYSFAVIGDVVGKGVQAGLVVAACDGVLTQALVGLGRLSPGGEAAAIRQVVKALVQGVFVGRPQRAMTALIMLVHESGAAWLATIGHLPLVGIRGKEARLVTTRNPWFNAQLQADELEVAAFHMQAGELFIGFTDGVCANSRELRRLVKTWSQWDKLGMEELMERFARFDAVYDDVSVMMLRSKAVA